ncbi:MAG: hypothetical protein ACOC2W_01110 [bacterium]
MEKYLNGFEVIDEFNEEIVVQTKPADHLIVPRKIYNKKTNQYVYSGFDLIVKKNSNIPGLHNFTVLNAEANMYKRNSYSNSYISNGFNSFDDISGEYSLSARDNNRQLLVNEDYHTYFEIYNKLIKIDSYDFCDMLYTRDDNIKSILKKYVETAFEYYNYKDTYDSDFVYDTFETKVKSKDNNEIILTQYFIVKINDGKNEMLVLFETIHNIQENKYAIPTKNKEQLVYIINEEGEYLRIEREKHVKEIIGTITTANPNMGLQDYIYNIRINNYSMEDIYVDNKVDPKEIIQYYSDKDEDAGRIMNKLLNPFVEYKGNKFYRKNMRYMQREYISIINNRKSKIQGKHYAEIMFNSVEDGSTNPDSYNPVNILGQFDSNHCVLLYQDVTGMIIKKEGKLNTYIYVDGYYIPYSYMNSDVNVKFMDKIHHTLSENFQVAEKLTKCL